MVDNANTGSGRRGFDRHCCFILLLSISLCLVLAFFIYCLLPTYSPILSIQDYSIRTLKNKTRNSTDTAMFFNLELHNKNLFVGIYYDAFNLTLYPASSPTTLIFYTTCPGFYQRHLQYTHFPAVVHGLVWNGSGAVFRVTLETFLRYKVPGRMTPLEYKNLHAVVEVNRFGLKVGTPIMSATSEERGCYPARLLITIFTFVLISI